MSEKLKSLRKELREAIKRQRSAALYLSGGSDSILLMLALVDTCVDFSVVCFDANFTKEQKRSVDELIKKYDLRVFSYPPSNAYLIGNGRDVTMVEEYAVGRASFPFLRDCVKDESRCAFDVKINTAQMPRLPLAFGLNILGSRKYDRHFAMNGRVIQQKEFQVGDLQFIAPLFDWTRREVKEGLKHYGFNYKKPQEREDTGNLPMCLNCLSGAGEAFCPKENKTIAALGWSPADMLNQFQKKYGIK